MKTKVILNFSKSIFFLFMVLNFSVLYAQKDTVYVDENFNKLSKPVFYQRLKSKAYEGYRHTTDTLVLETLRLKFVFGSLEPKIKSQLFKLFTVRHKIDTTKMISILYIDSLRAKRDFPNKNYVLVHDSLGNVIGKENYRSDYIFAGGYIDVRKYKRGKSSQNVILTHNDNYKTFLKRCENFLKSHKKYKNVIPLIFYNYNVGTESEVEDINAYKDYAQLLRKLFHFKNDKPVHIIIKDNGEYYVNYFYVASGYEELYKSKEWNKQKAEFL